MKKNPWVKFKHKFLNKVDISDYRFNSFNVYKKVHGDDSEELVNVPMFSEEDGDKVFCADPKFFLPCIKRLDDATILQFACNMESFEKRFERLSDWLKLNDIDSYKLESDAKEYIMKRARKIDKDLDNYIPDAALINGKDIRAKDNFAYTDFDFFAYVDEDGTVKVSDYPAFFSHEKKNKGFGVCRKCENFLYAVEKLSAGAVMNISSNVEDFYYKYLVLADYFKYDPIQVEPIFDEAMNVINARANDILKKNECKREE